MSNGYNSGLMVKVFVNDQATFFREFVASMIKLENVGVLENGGVKLYGRAVN